MTVKGIEDIYELSPAQRGMFLHGLYGVQGERHLQHLHCTLDGALDTAAFERAWQLALDRHPVLRTSFHAEPKPLQVVHRTVRLPLYQEDLGDLAAGERLRRLDAYLRQDRERGFDLGRPPLLRMALLRTAPDRHELVWSRHHLLLDGWSLALLLREVFASYEALCAGRDPAIAAPRPFREYILWLQGRDSAADEAFWRTTLAGVTRPTALLPVGDLPGAAGATVYEEAQARLSRTATAALADLAQRSRLTLNTLVQGAWALLLARSTGQRDAVFGTTVAGRPTALAGSEAMVGMFINTLPMRVAVADDARLADWLGGLQAAQAELRQHEHTPLAAIQEWSAVPAGLPLFESVLVFENYPSFAGGDGALPGGLRLRDVRFVGARTDYPLTVLALPGAELGLQVIADRRRFVGAAAALLDRLRTVLEGFAGASDRRLRDLAPFPAVPWAAGGSAEPSPGPGGRPTVSSRAPRTLPRTPIEHSLAAIWRELLGLPEVDVHTPFFELGGHSLLATRIVARVREVFAVDLPLRRLAEAPTVAELATLLAHERAQGGDERGLPALPRIVPRPAEGGEPFALTDVQHAYWVGRSGVYQLGEVAAHSYQELEVADLELPRFEAAVNALIERHGMLRAVVLPDGRQRILQQVPAYRIPVLDLHGAAVGEAEKRLAAVRAELSHQVLAADRWPLFDLRASRLPDGRWRLHVSTDALIRDAFSVRILLRELVALYRDPATPLPALEIGFRDYVQATAALEQSELFRRSQAYWRGRLPELPPAPELPLARDPGALSRPVFTRRRLTLAPPVWEQLKAHGTRAGLTPSGLLLAAFAEVLTAWSAGPRFTLNLTLFNRLPVHPQVDGLVGDFTSLDLLAVDNTVPGSFAVRARRLQEQLWEDLDHRHAGGVRVLRELARLRRDGGRATMPVVFTSTLVMAHGDEGDAGGLGEEVFSITQTPQVLLDHQVAQRDGALVINWDAVDEAFPAGVLDAMFEAFQGLLERLAAAAGSWQEPVPCLVPAQQLALRAAINSTAAPQPDGLLHQPFFDRAAEQPQAPAVIAAGRTLTYGELRDAAQHLAARLRAAGAGSERLVAIVMEPGWEQVAAVLAVLAAGAAYLPIDSDLPAVRRRHLLERGGVEVVLTQPWVDERIEWPAGVRRIAVDETVLVAGAPWLPPAPARPDQLAYVIFTSGSTGSPKGVMIEHRAALNTVLDINERFAVGPHDRVLALSALSFDLSVYDVFGILAAGGALVLPATAGVRDPAHWRELLERHRVTVWSSVPALLAMLVDDTARRPDPLLRAPDLRLVLLSGDWIPVTLPDRLRALVPAARVISLGGATEAAIWSIFHVIDTVDPSWSSIPYGRPLRNQTIHVLDEALEPRPLWVPGHLYIGGAGVARGYLGDEERTRASFVVHPRTGERLYRTGDLGRSLGDGTIEFLGRADLQVKIQGYRIELGEIETVLAEHPAVGAVVVAALGERQRGRRLVCYVVPAGSAPAPAADDLRAFLRERLPEYMVPPVYVTLDSLPLSANGKVDRGALPAPDWTAQRERPRVAPRDPVEQAVAKAWADILEMPGDRIGIHDTFYELGGDSLLATRMLAEVRESFQRDVPLRNFFEAPTVADLATFLRAGANDEKDGDGELASLAELLNQVDQLSPDEVEALMTTLAARENPS